MLRRLRLVFCSGHGFLSDYAREGGVLACAVMLGELGGGIELDPVQEKQTKQKKKENLASTHGAVGQETSSWWKHRRRSMPVRRFMQEYADEDCDRDGDHAQRNLQPRLITGREQAEKRQRGRYHLHDDKSRERRVLKKSLFPERSLSL
ncbi:unknown protein [Seminavis robusta]|uniref:Uncharacterized protein n=1 Tax=Seminavis robusta TaxID=568900 RepID=A0A9N8HAC8_9STRA|nr:unknown protein [Seminavis robusta]|eukprot:Sro290_g109361.1  (149) ;mRNA; f:50884-51330